MVKLAATLVGLGLVNAQRRVPAGADMRRPNRQPQGGRGDLRAFRGNELALRSMPQDFLLQAYTLNEEASAATELDRLYMQMFRAKAEKEGVPDRVYETIIEKVVTGTTQVDEYADGREPAMQGFRSNLCPEGNCVVPLTLKGIWGYGCWCTFELQADPGLMDGRSLPLNDYDEICMRMQKCLRCAEFDGSIADPPYECDARTNPGYNAQYAWSPLSLGIQSDCSAQNPNDECGEHLCTCEISLISDVLELLWDGTAYDFEGLHSRGFDQEENCPATEAFNGDFDKECCGFYGQGRQFYNSVTRGCCDNQKTYSLFTEDCCNVGDGTVKEKGTC